MLGKLLKYEIKAFGRIMLPLYGVAIAVSFLFAVIIRLSMNGFAKFLMDRFAVISGILFVLAVAAVGIVMLVLIVQRFYRNLLGNEGYLMFTLPASTLELILSKAISAMLWICIGIAAGTAAGLVMITIVSDMNQFLTQLQEIMTYFNAQQHLALNIVRLILLILLGLMASLCKIYAAIAIGHQLPDHRLAGAVGAYIGIGIIEVICTSIPGVRSLLGTDLVNVSVSRTTLVTCLVALAQIVFYGFITWRLLDRRLNLE